MDGSLSTGSNSSLVCPDRMATPFDQRTKVFSLESHVTSVDALQTCTYVLRLVLTRRDGDFLLFLNVR